MTNLTSVPKQETEYLEQQQLPLAPQTPTTALPDVGSFVKCEDKIFEITGHSALPGRLELEDLSGNKKCIHHKDITLLNSEEIATLKEQRQLKPKDKCRYVGTNEKYQNIIWEVVDVNNPFIVVVNNNTNNMFDADELRKIE
jgi:hypothetical protein